MGSGWSENRHLETSSGRSGKISCIHNVYPNLSKHVANPYNLTLKHRLIHHIHPATSFFFFFLFFLLLPRNHEKNSQNKMMLATYNCGCPPPSKPSCSPCCETAGPEKISSIKQPPKPTDCPESSCCQKRPLKPVIPQPKIKEPPPCCPVKPSSMYEFERPSKLRSDIEEKGLPYKQMEVMINDNKVVLRTQKEFKKPEYDPPCECIEDTQPKVEEANDIEQAQVPGSRTVTLYPKVKVGEVPAEGDMKTKDEAVMEKPEKEQNPNLFMFKMKKVSGMGDKAIQIDFQFKVARPWSLQKRKEIEDQIKMWEKPLEPVVEEVKKVKITPKPSKTVKKKKKK